MGNTGVECGRIPVIATGTSDGSSLNFNASNVPATASGITTVLAAIGRMRRVRQPFCNGPTAFTAVVTCDVSHEALRHPGICPKTQKRPDSIGALSFRTITSDQCETAPLAPSPVCERTNCGKNNARSPCAAFDLSVTEKNQIPTNAMMIEKNAGYSYGKIAFS